MTFIQMCSKLKRLKICITFLLALNIITGIILASITACYHRILVAYLAEAERQIIVARLSNIYLIGFELIVCYTVELILCHVVSKSGTILKHTKILAALNGFCIIVILCGILTIWFQYSSIQSLKLAAEISLFEGIDLYFSDPQWKFRWDGLQYNNECCGVNSYEDWKEAAWMPDDCSEASVLILIPYACCKRSLTSCFQSYSPHENEAIVTYLNFTEINTNGCFAKFSDKLHQLFFYITSIMGIICVLQILLLLFEFIFISRAKMACSYLNCVSDFNDNDDRPMVIVKYPRNVRCITLTDGEDFDDVNEEEECPSACDFIHQEVSEAGQERTNIFLH